jgi:hypothetical protein
MSGRRVLLSIRATLFGWLAATLLTLLFFEVPELWRNAGPGARAYDLVLGMALWTAFTLVVCAGVWCVVVLPMALWLSPDLILRRPWRSGLMASIAAVALVGWRLGTWADLRHQGPDSPLTARLFLQYTSFGVTLAWVTMLVYARLLRGRSEP